MHQTAPDEWYESSAPALPLSLMAARAQDFQPEHYHSPRRPPRPAHEARAEEGEQRTDDRHSAEGWARPRFDVPMRPPRTRPVFSSPLPGIQVVEPPRRWAHPHWLYAVSGLAAMALGVYASSALVPTFDPANVEAPLSRSSEWREDPLIQPHSRSARSMDARAEESAARRPRKQATTAGKNNRPAPALRSQPSADSAGSHSYARGNLAAIPFDPSAEPDMDLMDIPSSPMEQRALTEHGRSPVTVRAPQDNSESNTAEALSKLDLINDPGAATGTLHINSRPWTHVFIDDRLVGTTPLRGLTISSGRHRIRLMSEAFGMSKLLDITIAPGEHLTRVVSLDD